LTEPEVWKCTTWVCVPNALEGRYQDMTRKTLLPLLALAATAAVPTTAALAQDTARSATVPATAASLKIESGYAYYDSFKPRNQRLIVVVVKTHGELPRRFDGLIRAGGQFNKHNGGSVGSVGGKASRCYTFTVPLKDGRFIENDGKKGAKGSPGRYVVRMTAKGADGHYLNSTKTISLRDRKAGDRVGQPLSC
jgi:hypothetical protein